MQLMFALLLLFSIVVAILAVQNTLPVTVKFLLFEVPNVPVAVLVLISAAVGAILMLVLGLSGQIRGRRAIHQRDAAIRRLEAEIAQLRLVQPSLPPEPASMPFPSERTPTRTGEGSPGTEGPG